MARGMLIFVEWEGYLVTPVVGENFRNQSWPLKQAEIVKARPVNFKMKVRQRHLTAMLL